MVEDISLYLDKELQKYTVRFQKKRETMMRQQTDLIKQFVSRIKNDFDRKEENFIKAYISDISFTMSGIDQKSSKSPSPSC